MRSAIRGDFERLATRRGSQELMREPGEARADEAEYDPDVEVVPVSSEAPAPAPTPVVDEVDPVAPDLPTPELEPPAPEPPPPEPPAPEPSVPERAPRSFLDRLLGR
jgi:hypothetical protein